MNNQIIKNCKYHGKTTFYVETQEKNGVRYVSSRCKKCRVNSVNKWRRNYKQKLLKHFGNKCEICSYNKCVYNLEFHHVYPKTKSFGLAAKGRIINFLDGLKEAKKCILVCSNCHGEIEVGILKVPENLVKRVKEHLQNINIPY